MTGVFRALALASLVAGPFLCALPARAVEPSAFDVAMRSSIGGALAASGAVNGGVSDAAGAGAGVAATGMSAADRRSPSKAFALSMLLPGLGQRYTGHRGREVSYYLGEAALWTTFAVLKIQGNRREEDFIEWAKTFAGAKIEGYDRDEEYYQTISRYLSSDDYNFEVKALARLIHPGDTPEVRAAQLAYIEEFSVKGDETWEWTSRERRDDFRVIRHRSLEADRRANWTLGGLILLRVVSAIDAARAASRFHAPATDIGFSASPILPSGEPGVALELSRAF